MHRMRFTGPPRASLSGTVLEAGLAEETLQPVPEQSFFGELTAQPELIRLPPVMPPLPPPLPAAEEQPTNVEMAAAAPEANGVTSSDVSHGRPPSRGGDDLAPSKAAPAALQSPAPPPPLSEELFSEPAFLEQPGATEQQSSAVDPVPVVFDSEPSMMDV